MKKLLKILFVIVAIAVCFSGCHKYPDDPFISLRNPNDRLKGNTWKFTSYKINGVEHNHDFDNFLSPHTLTDVTFQFDNKELYYNISNIGSQQIFTNPYKWSSDSKTILFGVRTDIIYVPTDSAPNKFSENILQNPPTSAVYWTVEELYNSTFHISRNGVDIYFKKQ